MNEVPVALTDQIIARVFAGGVDTKADVEGLVRREISGVLKDCSTTLASELEKLETEE